MQLHWSAALSDQHSGAIWLPSACSALGVMRSWSRRSNAEGCRVVCFHPTVTGLPYLHAMTRENISYKRIIAWEMKKR